MTAPAPARPGSCLRCRTVFPPASVANAVLVIRMDRPNLAGDLCRPCTAQLQEWLMVPTAAPRGVAPAASDGGSGGRRGTRG